MPQLPASLAHARAYADVLRQADCQVNVVKYRAPLDNYSPARRMAYGYAVEYVRANGQNGMTLWRTDFGAVGTRTYDELIRALFIVDNGRSATPFDPCGWAPSADADQLFIMPFPLEYNADGSRRTRADDGRPVDMSGWYVGPRRTYHLKVSEV